MIKLKLSSINPNPKGFYYDMDSYNTVMSNIKDLELRLFNFTINRFFRIYSDNIRNFPAAR